ncbi:MAG: hypothetical protein JW827_12230 [Spirochaetes bacterium]|nr:hypothetical protein [Spirochaetota bacterium]
MKRTIPVIVLVIICFYNCHNKSDRNDMLSSFILLNDIASSFRLDISNGPDHNHVLSIERRNVEPSVYDGRMGYNLFLIRRFKADSPDKKQDLFSRLLKGQYRIIGYNDMRKELYAFRIVQEGVAFIIKNIVRIEIDKNKVKDIKPRGSFQYGSINPSGTSGILIDERVIAVDLKKGSHRRLDIKVDEDAANPWMGKQVGGGYDLSGKYMNIVWSDEKNCILFIRGKDRKETKRIKINLSS